MPPSLLGPPLSPQRGHESRGVVEAGEDVEDLVRGRLLSPQPKLQPKLPKPASRGRNRWVLNCCQVKAGRDEASQLKAHSLKLHQLALNPPLQFQFFQRKMLPRAVPQKERWCWL
jgi:hypothetical protein